MADAAARIAIVGGGPVGMALALALHQQGIGSAILEARDRESIKHDARVLALSFGSRQILERIGVWSALKPTSIETIHVSRSGGFGRARLRAKDLAVPALGYVLAASELISALDATLRNSSISYLDRCMVGTRADVIDALPDTALTVWAEGAIADGAGQFHDYHQSAVLCTATTKAPHQNVAWERFTETGPVALLPLGAAYAVVLTCTAAEAEAVTLLDDHEFTALLQARFGERHQFVAVGPRVRYPLSLRWRDNVSAEREVWLGNAAQTLHPVAGQGFNLALRDVWELTRHLASADGKRNPGALHVLQAYADARATDRRSVIGFTNGLIEVFGSELAPLAHARGAGLMALDLLPPLRNFLARRMMFGARGW